MNFYSITNVEAMALLLKCLHGWSGLFANLGAQTK